eukprot:gene8332-9904_t
MSDETLLSLLVVNIDYKLQQWRQPYPALSASVVNLRERKPVYVPVLPYVYFRPENLQHAAFDTEAKAKSLLNGLEAALEDLLFNYKSTTWKTAAPRQNRSQYSKRKRIHSLETVRQKTIYGMHMDSYMFIKVVLYDPNDVKRVAAVLEEGAIRGISMQSYESHIPYLLQFTSDYNIQPMGWMHLSSAKFRLPLPLDPVATLHNEPHPNTTNSIQPTNPAAAAASTQDSASVDPTNGLFNSPIKGIHNTAMGGVVGGANNSIYTGVSIQPVREDSTLSTHTTDSKPSLKAKITAVEPHVFLTQHQLSHYVGAVEEINCTELSTDNTSDVGNIAKATTTQGGKKSRLLTQSSIPQHLVWNNENEDGTINFNEMDTNEAAETTTNLDNPLQASVMITDGTTLTASEQEEVDRLLQGITAEDMRWSQDVVSTNVTSAHIATMATSTAIINGDSTTIIPTTSNSVANASHTSTNLITKESTCELEIDIHHSYILNTAHPRVAFGAELWAEEKARCAVKGLSMETIATPPSTQTVYREPQPTEVQYRNRFENLKLKGFALRAASKSKLIHSNVNSISGVNTLPEPSSRLAAAPYGIGGSNNDNEADKDGSEAIVVVLDVPLLTQAAAPAPTENAKCNQSVSGLLQPQLPASTQHSPPLSSLPLPISQWAQERIHEATQQAHLDISTQQHYLNPDQKSAQRPPLHPSTNSGNVNKRLATTPITINIDNPFQNSSISRSSSLDRANSIFKRTSSIDSNGSSDNSGEHIQLTQHSPDYDSSNDHKSMHSPVSHLLQHSYNSGTESPLLVPFLDSMTTITSVNSEALSSTSKRSKFVDPYGTKYSERISPILLTNAYANSSGDVSEGSVIKANNSGTKSISSVFRKRKHSAVSFALFPDKVVSSPSNTGDSPTEGVAHNSVGIMAVAPTSSVKKAKRSVSFREMEEIVAPPVYSDTKKSTNTLLPQNPTLLPTLPPTALAGANKDDQVPVRKPLSFSGNASSAHTPIAGTSTNSTASNMSSSGSNRNTLRSIRSVYSNAPPLPSPPVVPLTPFVNSNSTKTTSTPEQHSAIDNNCVGFGDSPSPALTPIPHDHSLLVSTVQSPTVITESASTGSNSKSTANIDSVTSSIPTSSPPLAKTRAALLKFTQPQLPFTSSYITLHPTFTTPSASTLTNIESFGLSAKINPPASYSVKEDTLLSATVGCGNAYLTDLRKLKYLRDLPTFDGGYPASYNTIHSTSRPKLQSRVRCLIPTFLPPHPSLFKQSNKNAAKDKRLKQRYDSTHVEDTSQIATPTQTPYTCAEPIPVRKNTTSTEPNNSTSCARKHRLTTLSIEIHCATRQDFLPNPKYDAVQCIIYAVDDVIGNSDSESVQRVSGVICVLQEDKTNCRKETTHAAAVERSTTDSTNNSTITADTAANNTIVTTITGPSETTRQAQQRALLASCALPTSTYIEVVPTEQLLFTKLISIVRTIDPDFIVSYNIENRSIGYLIKRAYLYEINLVMELSRVPEERGSYRNGPMPVFTNGNNTKTNGNNDQMEEENPIYEPTDNIDKSEISSEIILTGRIVLNVWRLMREEVKLFNYTYNNVAAHVMNVRVPYFTHAQLTKWFINPLTRYKTIRYIHLLTTLNLQLLETVDHIRKTSECARLYHIDYNSVITRGSQYRVEASLLHKAHTNDYILLSPTRRAVASQAPMEVIPLVLEPQSTLYTDPVLVLDFQSLYPSMMLAYNLCYSTIMGKMRTGEGKDGNNKSNSSGEKGSFASAEKAPIPTETTATVNTSTYAYKETDTTERLGASSYPESISALNATLHTNNTTISANDTNAPYVAPNGSVFCHKNTRLGILPQMVQEMLTTRVMVKRAMKRHAKPSGTGGGGSRDVLQKVMDARQLAIKLLSNVTYGYTSAGFSGRMPMAELADAIVQSGRSTLEWTIREIQSHSEWKAKVVYGDTDSVFVHLKGRSREEAFRIGQEISEFITALSPAEVILKFEKVYLPCVLVTKKRYVGNMYETVTQVIPHFEAKGIEVVRRDQCPAVVKMQEKALRMLFETLDISKVKSYIVNAWSKMMQGGDKLLLRDFIFSKEVRYGQYASVSSQPPGAVVACKAVLHDEIAVPPYNWRVPYVVVCGVPNAQLRSLVCSPEEVLRRGSELRLNYVYYMTKCINPALDRVLSLCGGEVFTWFKSIARPKLRLRHINYDLYEDNYEGISSNSSDAASNSRHLSLQHTTNNKKRHKQTSMDQYTTQGTCEICTNDALPMKTLCHICTTSPLTTLTTLFNKLHVYSKREQTLSKICQNCAKYAQPSVLYAKNEVIGPDTCESLDCQIMYERARLVTKIEDCQVSLSEIEDL